MNTKKRILSTVIASLCIIFAYQANANLLINSSFEDSIPMFGWSPFGSGSAPEIKSTAPQDEDQVLKLFQDFSSADNWNGLYQDVPVIAGRKYRLSGYLRNGTPESKDTMQPGNSAFMKLEWFDADGTRLGVKEMNVDGRGMTHETPAGEWIMNQIEEVAPEKATQARIVILHQYLGKGHDGGSSWFDNINFEQIP